MKTKFINDLKVGENVTQFIVAVKKSEMKIAKNGDTYKNLILADRTGEINGKIWSNSFKNCESFETGKVISITGNVEEYQGQIQINIKNLQVVNSTNIDITDFLNTSAKDLNKLYTEIEITIKSVKNKFLRELLESFFKDPEFVKKFKQAPGALNIHHAYVGGLMEHIVEMLNLAAAIIKDFPKVNVDLIKTAIILHDLGKIKELETSIIINRTLEGKLLEHLSISVLDVEREIQKINDFPPLLRLQLLHIILSHHGHLEFGSPVVPMMTEALITHYVDIVSARINTAYQKTAESQARQEIFTEKIYSLETPLYTPKFDEKSTIEDQNSTLF